MTAKSSSRSNLIPIKELDALFHQGGLTRGRHQKGAAASQQLSKTGAAASRIAKKRNEPSTPGSKRPQNKTAAPHILRVPEWQQYAWLVHGFSTRVGGVSTVYQSRSGKPSCGELNLGLTPADTLANVQHNRERFVRALLDASPRLQSQPSKRTELRLLRQIHSGLVHRSGAESPSTAIPLKGDAWIATEPGTLLGIQTADCIPVLVVDVRQRIVAAFHAGWRGTLARIVERGVGRMRAEFASRPRDLTAAIGPGIGRCCYSVGEEVRMEFTSQFIYAQTLFEEVFDLDPVKEKYPMLFLTARAPGHSNLGPSLHLDLAEANRRQLIDAGIAPQRIFALNRCTACDTTHFFSYRAEQGNTGRMVSAIGIRA